MSSSGATTCMDAAAPPLLLSGIDSLYVSYFLDTRNVAIDWNDLAYERERIRQSRTTHFSEVALGSETFALMPYGAFPYPYVLQTNDFEVRLAEALQPTCHVRYPSEGLWLRGQDSLTKRFRHWLQSVNLTPIRSEGVSRVDWAFDFHLPNLDFDEGNFVTRFKKDGKWRGNQKDESFQLGKGDLVLRVYNKSKEIRQASGKTWFYKLWGQTDNVWRVEVQARTSHLKQRDIVSLESLRDFEGDFLREFATNHTSIRVPTADSNRHRWPLHRLWIACLSAIAQMPQYGLVKTIGPSVPIDLRIHNQSKHIYSALRGLAALVQFREGSEDTPGLNDTLERLPRLLRDHHHPFAWDEAVDEKHTALRYGKW